MTVVNFLCPRENLIMKKNIKVAVAVPVAIISLMIISLCNKGTSAPPIPDTSPIFAYLELGRNNTPPTENKAVVADESLIISTQDLPQDGTPTEADFEPPNPADITEILTDNSAPRDNPTPTPTPSKSTTTATAYEPKMGDTRTVDGQKRVYFLGFGWIEDKDEPNQGVYIDGDGDINKMVGIME